MSSPFDQHLSTHLQHSSLLCCCCCCAAALAAAADLALAPLAASSLKTSLKTMSQVRFLQLSPRVPLTVPHLGHLRTPRLVALPSPLSRADILLQLAADIPSEFPLTSSYC